MILSGNGEIAFCAGADIKTVADLKGTPDEHKQDEIYRRVLQLNYAMARMKPIQVVFWDGIAIGGGIGIASEAPIRIVTETSVFSMPGILLNMIFSSYNK